MVVGCRRHVGSRERGLLRLLPLTAPIVVDQSRPKTPHEPSVPNNELRVCRLHAQELDEDTLDQVFGIL